MRGGACEKCGETRLATLCFHHREPKQKSFSLDTRAFATKKWDVLVEETDKCDLLCQNCHHSHHYQNSWDDMLKQLELETHIQLNLFEGV